MGDDVKQPVGPAAGSDTKKKRWERPTIKVAHVKEMTRAHKVDR